MPDDLGVHSNRLTDCPPSPNCVSSDATDEGHRIAPLRIIGEARPAWSALEVELSQRPRVRIVSNEGGYLHVVFTTAMMRYRDDVEFQLRRDRGEIAVRSASRVGHSDMNANRKRVESIRAALAARGFVAESVDPERS